MRRLRGVAAAVVVILLMGGIAFATDLPPGGTFVDDDGNVHEGNIEAIAAEGITLGCNPPDNTLYCPSEPVTRGQMAAFIHRALADVLAPGAPVEFVDDEASVFEADIEWLGATGVTRGCNPPLNNEFCPDDPVTRGQMAAFLVRALGLGSPPPTTTTSTTTSTTAPTTSTSSSTSSTTSSSTTSSTSSTTSSSTTSSTSSTTSTTTTTMVGDVTPPELVSFSIDPLSVDTSSGPAVITLTAQITDDSVGVASTGGASGGSQVRFMSPSGQSVDGLFHSDIELISGTPLDGLYEYEMVVPEGAEQGTWSVEYFMLLDEVGNRHDLDAADLSAAGFPTEFEQTGNEAITVGTFGAPLVLQSHRFVDTVGNVFERDIDLLAEAGITLGCNPPTNDRFCPDEVVTRDQMASFLARALGLKALVPLPRPSTTTTVSTTTTTTTTIPGNPGDIKNCDDFDSWAEAQAWFEKYYPHWGDVAKLDQDNDGIACESLPGAP